MTPQGLFWIPGSFLLMDQKSTQNKMLGRREHKRASRDEHKGNNQHICKKMVPKGSMNGTFTYIWLKSMVLVGKYLAILLVTFFGMVICEPFQWLLVTSNDRG